MNKYTSYSDLKKAAAVGWNTRNTASVLSHVLMPYGFAINISFKDLCATKVIRNPLVGRFSNDEEHITPGLRSWDGTYTSLKVELYESEFRVESAVKDDEQYILVTPIKHGRKPTVFIVEACLLWGNEGVIGKKDGRIYGEFGDKKITVYSTADEENYSYGWQTSPSFSFATGEPTAISTVPCTIDEAVKIINEGREKTEKEAEKYGDAKEIYTAMKCCLAWDTIFESEGKRVCSTVSRMWNMGWGGYVLFDWDTYFAGLMASVDNPELAYLNVFAITNEMTEDGFVPNFGCNDDIKSRDRSQPPVGSAALLRIYKKYPADWAVKELYPSLIRWNRWFAEHRMTKEGYMCWGSDYYEAVNGRWFELNAIGDRAGAALESGLDNSPMYDDIPYDDETHLMMLADVGLCGLYIKDCEALIELAEISCNTDDIAELTERRDKVEKALLTLWNPEDGIFENRNLVTGELSGRLSPTNFYALYSRKVTEEQKKSMLEKHLYNEEEFWGDWVLPSIMKNDPAFPDQDYWRGRIWAPMNYLVYEALVDAKLDGAAHDLAVKSENLLLQEWRAHGHVHENYSGYDGMGCGVGNSDKFYHWGGLLGLVAMNDKGY